MSETLKHPNAPDTAVTVDDPAPWKAQGWLVTEPEQYDAGGELPALPKVKNKTGKPENLEPAPDPDDDAKSYKEQGS